MQNIGTMQGSTNSNPPVASYSNTVAYPFKMQDNWAIDRGAQMIGAAKNFGDAPDGSKVYAFVQDLLDGNTTVAVGSTTWTFPVAPACSTLFPCIEAAKQALALNIAQAHVTGATASSDPLPNDPTNVGAADNNRYYDAFDFIQVILECLGAKKPAANNPLHLLGECTACHQ